MNERFVAVSTVTGSRICGCFSMKLYLVMLADFQNSLTIILSVKFATKPPITSAKEVMFCPVFVCLSVCPSASNFT